MGYLNFLSFVQPGPKYSVATSSTRFFRSLYCALSAFGIRMAAENLGGPWLFTCFGSNTLRNDPMPVMYVDFTTLLSALPVIYFLPFEVAAMDFTSFSCRLSNFISF